MRMGLLGRLGMAFGISLVLTLVLLLLYQDDGQGPPAAAAISQAMPAPVTRTIATPAADTR
jgi:hypothetical protein